MSHTSRRRLALAVSSVLAAAPAAFGIDRSWNEPDGGLFQVSTNWTPEGAPDGNDIAVFDLRGNNYTVGFGDDAATAGLRVGSDTLTFDLAGNTYNAGGSFQLAPGQNNTAHLTVSNGMFGSLGTNIIAGGIGSAASLTLSDRASFAGANSQLRIGQVGAGVFTIRNSSDAVLGSLAVGGSTSAIPPNTTSGAAHVVGLGSMLTVTGATTIGEAADGSVSILDGARFTTPAVMLASQPTGRGTVLVSGPGSVWQANGRIDVGPGSGTITALNGARIQSTGARLGVSPTSSTVVLLSGANTAWVSQAAPFDIGAQGSADFTIADGAALSLTSATVGSFTSSSVPPASATVRVTGVGSYLRASQSLNFNMFGRTNLIVEDGASLSAAMLSYGTSPGPVTANISIDGVGSTVSLTQSLLLNRHNLNITNGGTLTTVGANLAGISQDSAVVVRIVGAGSNWNSTVQPFQINQSNGGTAEVYLEDGGQLTTPSLNIGGSSTAPGLLSVSGEGSRLSVTQTQALQVGMQTNLGAELRVKDGGAVTSRGPIRINAPSRVILDGGSISTVGGPPIENAGLILHSGGTITTGTFTNTGETHLRSHDAIMSVNLILNQRLLHGTGRVTGALSNGVSGEVRATGADRLVFAGQLPSPTNSNAGRINLLNGGTIEFGTPLTNTASGVIAFSGGGSFHSTGAPAGAPGNSVNNLGQVLFSGGGSNFVSSLTNSAETSKVIVTGNGTATFHGPVAHNMGELRVSQGSTAVFLAPVTGAGEFTGAGTKLFEAGQSEVAQLSSGGDTIVQAPASLSVARVRENELRVRGQVTIPSIGGRNDVNNLVIEGDGQLDLSNNDLAIHSGAERQAEVLARVKQYIASARNAPAGRWKGPGLTSSVAANTPFTTLALGATDDGVLVKYTYNGDANLDGRVNSDDYFRIDSGFLAQPANPQFANGDFNYDEKINSDDYFLIDSAFLGQGDALETSALAAVVVPEPGAAALVVVGGLIAMRRRRRR